VALWTAGTCLKIINFFFVTFYYLYDCWLHFIIFFSFLFCPVSFKQGGVECKRQVDKVIDKCDSMQV
jgi:hypothetical protein